MSIQTGASSARRASSWTLTNDSNSTSSPRVSVIVPTLERPEFLERCLRSLLMLDHDSFEVIVVDQSADARSANERIVAALDDPRVLIVHQDERGVSLARNEGMRIARGTVLAFTDDDCTVSVDWLRDIDAECTAEAGARVVYGAFIPGKPDTETTFTPKFEPGRLRLIHGIIAPERFKGSVAGGNMSAHREVFERIGGFDPLLGAGAVFPCSEDHDIMERALQAGFTVALDPRIRVFHWGARSYLDGSAQRLRAGYSLGYGALLAKHLRRGDVMTLYRLLRVLGYHRRTAWQVLVHRRLSAARGLGNLLQGFFRGLRQPLDRKGGVFKA